MEGELMTILDRVVNPSIHTAHTVERGEYATLEKLITTSFI